MPYWLQGRNVRLFIKYIQIFPRLGEGASITGIFFKYTSVDNELYYTAVGEQFKEFQDMRQW